MLVDQRAVGLDRLEDALHRCGCELAGGVNPLAQSRYLGPPLELLDPSAADVCDKQAGRVRPEIDYGDPAQSLGSYLNEMSSRTR